MSTLTDILDRLTDIGTLQSQISVLVREQGEMRSIVLKEESDLAELRGQLKAMIQMQSGGDKRRLK
jgi:Spy/CpxP family protein refolding chaperone